MGQRCGGKTSIKIHFPSKDIYIFFFGFFFVVFFFVDNAFVAYTYITMLCSYSFHIVLSFFSSISCYWSPVELIIVYITYYTCNIIIYVLELLLSMHTFAYTVYSPEHTHAWTHIFIFKQNSVWVMRESMQHFFLSVFMPFSYVPLPIPLHSTNYRMKHLET